MRQNSALWLGMSLLLAGCQPASQGTSIVSPSGGAHSVTVGLVLPFTGPEPDYVGSIKNGVVMAVDEVNQAGGANGLTINLVTFDSGNNRQFDAGRAAVSARKMVDNPDFVAVIGPMMSTEGKAMSPILSGANLATLTPSSTNPDITDPKFTAMFRPSGKAIYFRTLTTDALQGPNMANWMRDKLKVKSVYVLDDGGVYGKGVADGFESQARKVGITVLGHVQLDPDTSDYTAVLAQIKMSGSEAIYYGGQGVAGAKLVAQAHGMLPNVIKAGADGIQGGPFLKRVGFPAAEGWYTTNCSPHVLEEPAGVAWVAEYRKRFPGQNYDDYSVTAYDAGLVVADAIKRVTASGKPVNRDTMRDAIQQTELRTVQGEISFDPNGDIVPRVVSVFQYRENKSRPIDDYPAHTPYVGAALEMPQG
jgi:branched-chain amino acid transport system substrate-binding protein